MLFWCRGMYSFAAVTVGRASGRPRRGSESLADMMTSRTAPWTAIPVERRLAATDDGGRSRHCDGRGAGPGDDGSVETVGGTVRLMRDNATVRMVSELDGLACRPDRIDVDCTFVLRNEGHADT